MQHSVRILGLDPGLRHTGWGIVEHNRSGLKYIGHGTVHSENDAILSERLGQIFKQLKKVIQDFAPHEAAVEQTFMNKNPASALKLGMARGVVLLAPSMAGIFVGEYSANHVKKSVVGAGHASKDQVARMVKILLGGPTVSEDAADALAVAICHAHHRHFQMKTAV